MVLHEMGVICMGRTTIHSEKYSLDKRDVEVWAKNALIFLGPALLVLLGSVIEAIPQDWKYGAVALYALNIVTDLLRKFLAGGK